MYLPKVEGRYTFNANLSSMVWFQVGGPADVLYKPKDVEDLSAFLARCPTHIPITLLGVGSNVLIRDGGIPGVVIKLGRGFNHITLEGDLIRAGAGALDRNVALFAAENNKAGLEFFAGIPGTIGGALKMNAGAYGTEVKDVLEACIVMDRQGKLMKKQGDEMGFAYRQSNLRSDEIVVEAWFRASQGNREESLGRIHEIMTARAASQPVKGQTGGSTFKNLPTHSAWELVDQAGCRGLRYGHAQVSEKHCNFVMNTGGASAYEIETLIEEVRRRVLKTSGLTLTWEIKRLGSMESRATPDISIFEKPQDSEEV